MSISIVMMMMGIKRADESTTHKKEKRGSVHKIKLKVDNIESE